VQRFRGNFHIYFSLYRPHPPASAFAFHLLTLNLAKAPGQFSVGTTIKNCSIFLRHQHAVLMGLVDTLDHGTFMIGLEAVDPGTELRPQRLQTGIDLRHRDRAVLGRISLAEHTEIDAVQNQNFHRRFGMRMPMERRL
jgi:hypothetical protein